MAFNYYKRPASFQLGTLAIKSILQKQGIRFGNSILADGSGLSRHNLVAPKTMLSVLEYIAKNEDKLHLMETFPIAGVDGTISGRGGLISPPLVKNVIAKTGSLKGVYKLSRLYDKLLEGKKWPLFNLLMATQQAIWKAKQNEHH